MRRQFALPAEDIAWLESTGKNYELVAEGGVLRVVIHDFPVPPGYNVPAVSVSVRIEPGYPDTQLDMVYAFPHLVRIDGVGINNLTNQSIDGKVWQRWSRHRTAAAPWIPGQDNLERHYVYMLHWLAREVGQ